MTNQVIDCYFGAGCAGGLGPLSFGGHSTPWHAGATTRVDPRKRGVKYQYAYVEDSTYTWNAAIGLVYYDSIEACCAGNGIPAGRQLMGWSHNRVSPYGSNGLISSHAMAPWDTVVDPSGVQEVNLILNRISFTAGPDATFQMNQSAGGIAPPSDTYPSEPTWVRRVTVDTYAGGSPTRSYSNSGVIFFGYAPGQVGYTDAWTSSPDGGAVPMTILAGDYSIVCRAVPDCAEFVCTCAPVTGSYLQLQTLANYRPGSPAHGVLTITDRPVGPLMESTDPRNTQVFWEAAYAVAVAAGDMAPGLVWNVDYPVATANACLCEAT